MLDIPTSILNLFTGLFVHFFNTRFCTTSLPMHLTQAPPTPAELLLVASKQSFTQVSKWSCLTSSRVQDVRL